MVRKLFLALSLAFMVAAIAATALWVNGYWALAVVLPLVGLGVYDVTQRRHTILRIYPVVGHYAF